MLETKILIPGEISAVAVSLLLGHLSGQNNETYVHIQTHVYTHIYTYFYTHPSVSILFSIIFKSPFPHQFNPFPTDILVGITLNLQSIWSCFFLVRAYCKISDRHIFMSIIFLPLWSSRKCRFFFICSYTHFLGLSQEMFFCVCFSKWELFFYYNFLLFIK